jgi:hypothetical protein
MSNNVRVARVQLVWNSPIATQVRVARVELHSRVLPPIRFWRTAEGWVPVSSDSL